MLKAHMDAREDLLVAQSKVAANTGHSLHKGTPRESFISEFLKNHLPSSISIGTGEIIDSNSRPGESRNQYDIILYRNEYPKLEIGGGVHAFLIESVIATIEVKSTLTEKDLSQAINAASNSKKLNPNFETIMFLSDMRPKVMNFVVAYNGPASMNTVQGWIPTIHASLGISEPNLPDTHERFLIPSASIDAIFVLKKGFINFDNIPRLLDSTAARVSTKGIKWVCVDSTDGNLLVLFYLLQTIINGINGRFLNAAPYLSNARYNATFMS